MAADVPNNNEPAQVLDAVLDGLLKAGEAAGLTALETAVPFLALPVVKQIIEAIANQITADISLWLQAQGTILVIRLEVWGETNGANAAIKSLVAAYNAKDLNGIDSATQALIDAARKAGQWDGSSTPS